MNKKLTYSCAFVATKEDFIINGYDSFLKPAIFELANVANKDFEKMISEVDESEQIYQIVLTINQLDG